VADVVLHLAQTSELAAAGGDASFVERFGRFMPADVGIVDEGAEQAVGAERGASPAQLSERWRAETWIHTGEIADALGVTLAPTDRLWHVARLAWRTLPYAFARAGTALHGPVEAELTGPRRGNVVISSRQPAAHHRSGTGC
jgi:hypothetical protein